MCSSTKIHAVLLMLCVTSFSFGQTFTQHSTTLEPLHDGKISWSDLDKDGDLDIIYSGLTANSNEFRTRVYENTAGTFVARTTVLPDLRNGEIALGDFDKDGDPDVLLSGLGASGNFSQLYENTGAFGFSLKASFAAILNSTPAWADIDNDEDLDLVIAGVDDQTGGPDPFVNKIFVYRNDASTFTPLADTNLPACSQCAMDWADANNDGWIDVAFTTVTRNSINYTELYLNNHNNTFTLDANQTLPGLYNGDLRWGDFDRDGQMDLVVSGIDNDGNINTQLYQNNHGRLEWMDAVALYSVGENWHHGTSWVDYNNDGLLDIVLSGRGGSLVDLEYVLKGFRNMGDSTFTEDDLGLEGLASGSLDFGDFDNDGDLDIAYMGWTSTGLATGILENKLRTAAYVANTKPLAPAAAGLTERFFRKEVQLKWPDGSDAQTPTDGLSYNFWFQQGAAKSFVPASNLTTGYVMAANPANGYAQRITLPTLTEGSNYSWAVQSIDGTRTGSLFTVPKSFYVIYGPEAVGADLVDQTHVKLTWLDNSTIETSYRVDRSLSPTTGFATRGTLGVNVTTYTDNFAFVPETWYYYRLYAVNATNASGYDSLKVIVPAKPENVGALEVHAARIAVTWDDMSEFEDGYVVERRLASEVNFTVLDTLEANTIEYQDQGLTEGTTYAYRVRAINGFGYSEYSDVGTLTSNFRPRGADIAKAGVEDTNVTFTEQEFADQFTDADATDYFVSIFVAQLPDRGILKLGSAPVTAGQQIARSALGTLVYTPAQDDNGLHPFKFYFSDGKDSSDVAYSANVNLAPVNDSPLFTIPAKITLDEDFEPVTITPEIYIPTDELSQSMTWTITPASVADLKIELDAATGVIKLSPEPNAHGSWQFTIEVSDGQASSNTHSATVDVTVRSINDAPYIHPIGNIAVEQADPVPAIQILIDDPDSPLDEIILGVTSDNQSVIKDSNMRILDGELLLTPELKVGKAVITIRATDGFSVGTRSFTLEIMTITDVEDFVSGVDVYPNPVNRVLNVSVGENFTPPFKVIVRDALGRDVVNSMMETTKTEIDFSPMKGGMYYMKVMTPENEVLYEGKVVRE